MPDGWNSRIMIRCPFNSICGIKLHRSRICSHFCYTNTLIPYALCMCYLCANYTIGTWNLQLIGRLVFPFFLPEKPVNRARRLRAHAVRLCKVFLRRLPDCLQRLIFFHSALRLAGPISGMSSSTECTCSLLRSDRWYSIAKRCASS